MNKMDLVLQVDCDILLCYILEECFVLMLVKDDLGVDCLEDVIFILFFSGKLELVDLMYVSNVCYIVLFKKVKQFLIDVYEVVEQFILIDMIQIDVCLVWEYFGEIVGDMVYDVLIDQIFFQFCLGK